MKRLYMLATMLLCTAIAAKNEPESLREVDTFSQAEMYTHWIENRCIGRLDYGKTLTDDACKSAAAWLQFGNLPIEAYNDGDAVIDRYLKVKLSGSVPGTFRVLQCTLIAASPDVKRLYSKYEAMARKMGAKPWP